MSSRENEKVKIYGPIIQFKSAKVSFNNRICKGECDWKATERWQKTNTEQPPPNTPAFPAVTSRLWVSMAAAKSTGQQCWQTTWVWGSTAMWGHRAGAPQTTAAPSTALRWWRPLRVSSSSQSIPVGRRSPARWGVMGSLGHTCMPLPRKITDHWRNWPNEMWCISKDDGIEMKYLVFMAFDTWMRESREKE